MATGFKAMISFLAILLIMVTTVTGYFLYNKKAFAFKHRKVVHVNAMGLYATYISDSLNAEKKYTDHTLVVSGEVFTVFLNAQQQQVVLLKTATPKSFVNCTFESTADNIKSMDKIVVKGICNGIGQAYPGLGIAGDIYLTECLPGE